VLRLMISVFEVSTLNIALRDRLKR
jgi:hypothetical protein